MGGIVAGRRAEGFAQATAERLSHPGLDSLYSFGGTELRAHVGTFTAQLTDTQRAEKYLAYLEREWARVPQIAAEWAAWDEDDRLDLHVEWGIREDRLADLRGFAGKSLLLPEQTARFDRLQELIERNRPQLEHLFASCYPGAPAVEAVEA